MDEIQNLQDQNLFENFLTTVHPEVFEPPTTASKAGMISISLRVQYCKYTLTLGKNQKI